MEIVVKMFVKMFVKMLVATMSLVSFSMTSYATVQATSYATNYSTENCDNSVVVLAKMNLDSKAKAYGFENGEIARGTLKKLSSYHNGSADYSVVGFIYKAEYLIQVGVDSSCGIETLSIHDESTP